jgi:hypothetical protein
MVVLYCNDNHIQWHDTYGYYDGTFTNPENDQPVNVIMHYTDRNIHPMASGSHTFIGRR